MTAPRTIKRLPADRGLMPLDQPVAGLAIEELLAQERSQRDATHVRSAEPARLIASDAYACRRKIAFGRLGVPRDITYDSATLMTFRAGDFYHDVVQRALIQFFDARTELDFDWRPAVSIYGKADGLADPGDGDGAAVIEIKSQAGYGFDLAVGARKSAEGPGPKIDHLIQAGLAAMSPQLAAERVWIIYVNKDRGVAAEWLIGLDEPLPHVEVPDMDLASLLEASIDNGETDVPGPTIRQLVGWELDLLAADVLAVMDAGDLPARLVPGFGLVEGDPPRKDSRDDPWQCRYCSWQPTCADLPVERVDGWVAAFEAAKEGAA